MMFGLRLALAVGALALVACSDDAERAEPLPFAAAGPDAAPDPSMMGPYPVGVRTLTIYDYRRVKTSTVDGTRTPRKLVTEVWYPAVEAARGQPGVVYRAHDILPPDVADELAGESVALPTTAVRDADARKGDAPFPLVIFSHGNGGVRVQSTFFTEGLASHGFVVVAPDHEGDTLSDFLARGGLSSADVIGAYPERSDDVRFLMDHFTSLTADDPLFGKIDGEKIGVSGHSFGGLTTIRVSGLDTRVKAAVAMTPPGFTISWIGVDRSLADIGIPMMIQSGGIDRTLPPEMHIPSLWREMARPRWWLSIDTAGHFTFSDLCVLDLAAIEAATNVGVGDVLEDGCGEVNLAPELAYPTIRHYGVGLFNAALRGSTGSYDLLVRERAPEGAGEHITLDADP
jgi:predicted dienelactone hydrolase